MTMHLRRRVTMHLCGRLCVHRCACEIVCTCSRVSLTGPMLLCSCARVPVYYRRPMLLSSRQRRPNCAPTLHDVRACVACALQAAANSIGADTNTEMIITEKLDGGNCCIKGGVVFARTHSKPATHESFDTIKGMFAGLHGVCTCVRVCACWLVNVLLYALKWVAWRTFWLLFL